MKLIFLEVHGVLMMPICENVARLLQEPVKAFKPAVDALNVITRNTGAKIVITSAWRNAGIWFLENKFKEWGIEGKIMKSRVGRINGILTRLGNNMREKEKLCT